MKKKILIISILSLLLLNGCSNKYNLNDVQETKPTIKQMADETGKTEFYLYNYESNKNINIKELINNEKVIDLNKIFVEEKVENYKLINDKDEEVYLYDILDSNRKTLFLSVSPVCSACNLIDYNKCRLEFSDYNFIILTTYNYKGFEYFKEKNIERLTYYVDNERTKELYSIVNELKTPGQIYLNKDMTIGFINCGKDEISEYKENFKYIY